MSWISVTMADTIEQRTIEHIISRSQDINMNMTAITATNDTPSHQKVVKL